jgi:hypothetical protein
VPAVFDIEPDTDLIDELRSLRLSGIEVLTPAQQDPALNLPALFAPGQVVDGRAVVAKACELFGVPMAQVEPTDALDRVYALTPTIGFKRPASVFIPREDSVA